MEPLATETADQTPSISRRTANYPPSLWDDNFIQSLSENPLDVTQIDYWEELKDEMRHLILDKENDTIKLIELIDVLCQLGVSYHFDSEIKSMLTSIGSSLENSRTKLESNFHAFALLFRLLREYNIQDHKISANILLNSIKNESGSFTANITNDVRGLLSLYEASHLIVEGDKELDEAREFTIKHLSNYLNEPLSINCHLVKQIEYAMEVPIYWRFPRLHTRWFIDSYGMQENINSKLLEFAKLDFNMVQSLHKKEIKELSRWWKNLGLIGDEFSFTRDRLIETYTWSMGCTSEPQFWRCREMFFKFGCFIVLIDDIYDLYGALEELKLLTKAVDEWEIIEHLPSYMKMVLQALFDTVNSIAHEILLEKGFDILPYLKRAWRDQCNAYLKEAIWYYTGYTPTLNEYIENAWLSIAVPPLLIGAHCVSTQLTKDALDRIEFHPNVARYSSLLVRLYDDMETSIDELERGDVPKAIQCHMKETNLSESDARNHIKNLIEKYWKLLNGELIANPNFEEPYKKLLLNLPRTTRQMYMYGDGFGKHHHKSKSMINSVLIDPISM